MKKWQKLAGFSILILSGILWALILIIPFLKYSKREVAGIMAILIIAGEITFYLSILILGKSIIIKLKSYLTFWKKKKNNNEPKMEDTKFKDVPKN